MTDFVCPACGYNANSKPHLMSHFNRKYSCTPGYEFPNLYIQRNRRFDCDMCEKSFSHSSGLYRHKRTCTGTGREAPATVTTNQQTVAPSITVQQKEKSESTVVQGNNNTTTVNSNNNQYVTINIVPFNPLSPPSLTHEKFMTLMQGGALNTILKMIEHEHFNPNKPESMNVYISNLTDKIGRVFKDSGWEVCSSEDLQREVFDLYMSSVNRMIEDTGDAVTEVRQKRGTRFPCLDKQMKKWERQTDSEYFDGHAQKQVGFLLYNKRNVVKQEHNLRY